MIDFIATLATKFEAIFAHFMVTFLAGANTVIKTSFNNIVIDTQFLPSFTIETRSICLYLEP
jgi:hypothetical protein